LAQWQQLVTLKHAIAATHRASAFLSERVLALVITLAVAISGLATAIAWSIAIIAVVIAMRIQSAIVTAVDISEFEIELLCVFEWCRAVLFS
jgi:hypothetical protein